MKWVDLKNKNTDELKDLLVKSQGDFLNLRFQVTNNQLKQVHKIKVAKKDIVMLKMILKERELENKTK